MVLPLETVVLLGFYWPFTGLILVPYELPHNELLEEEGAEAVTIRCAAKISRLEAAVSPLDCLRLCVRMFTFSGSVPVYSWTKAGVSWKNRKGLIFGANSP